MLPLMYWLELQKIMLFVKCFMDPPENFHLLTYISFITHSTGSAKNHKPEVSFKRTSTTRDFYFNSVVRLWNCLPSLDLSLSCLTLKYKLKFDFFGLNAQIILILTIHKHFISIAYVLRVYQCISLLLPKAMWLSLCFFL